MKFEQLLTVNAQEMRLLSDQWLLEADTPGRAVLIVAATSSVSGAVRYKIGWGGEIQTWFSGFVEQSIRIDAKQQRLIVRETAAALYERCPLSMRNVTAMDVIAAVAEQAGLQFVAGAFPTRRLSHVVNLGSGLAALQRLCAEMQLQRGTVQALPDGRIYCGPLAGMSPPEITLPGTAFSDFTSRGGGLLALPKVRPGSVLSISGTRVRVNRVELNGSTMRLNWVAE